MNRKNVKSLYPDHLNHFRLVIWEVTVEFPLSDRRINKHSFKTTFGCDYFHFSKRSRLIVIRGFKISLDLRTYGNSNQLLQIKLKLLRDYNCN